MSPTIKIALVILACVVAIVYFFSGNSNDTTMRTIEPKSDQTSDVSVIAFGDSLTAGYGLPASEGYPAQLETALTAAKISAKVINSGVSGETSRGNLERASFIRAQNPDIVLLGIGGNDALRALPVAETKKNITDTIKILTSGAHPPVVILLQMRAPLNAGLQYKRDFDRIYEEVATEQNVLLVPFLTAELFLDNTNKLSDGIHYNKVGYGKAVQMYIAPVVIDVIARLTKK